MNTPQRRLSRSEKNRKEYKDTIKEIKKFITTIIVLEKIDEMLKFIKDNR